MPPKKPLELIMSNGNSSHLTKAEIESRRKSELKAPSMKKEDVKPPSHLSSKMKKEYKRIAYSLIDLDIFSELDVDVLGRYLIIKEQYEKIYAEIQHKYANKESDEEYDKLQIRLDKWLKQAKSVAADMGLVVSSRCKLVVPKKEDNKPENKFSKFTRR